MQKQSEEGGLWGLEQWEGFHKGERFGLGVWASERERNLRELSWAWVAVLAPAGKGGF